MQRDAEQHTENVIKFEKQLAQVEQQILSLERQYLQSTGDFGNLVIGWDIDRLNRSVSAASQPQISTMPTKIVPANPKTSSEAVEVDDEVDVSNNKKNEKQKTKSKSRREGCAACKGAHKAHTCGVRGRGARSAKGSQKNEDKAESPEKKKKKMKKKKNGMKKVEVEVAVEAEDAQVAPPAVAKAAKIVAAGSTVDASQLLISFSSETSAVRED